MADSAQEHRDFVDSLTAAWARERPEFDTSRLEVEARIIRLARKLQARAAEHVASELHAGELNVMAALRRAGAPFRLTPTQLTRSLLISSGAMTNRIDRLEQRGLVRRVPSTTDRRKVLIELTPDGVSTIDVAMDQHVACLVEPFSVLDDEERATLADLLARLLGHLEQE